MLLKIQLETFPANVKTKGKLLKHLDLYSYKGDLSLQHFLHSHPLGKTVSDNIISVVNV